MSRLWTFCAIVKRYLIELKRYPFNTLSGLATLYIVFLLIFLGARYVQSAGVSLFGESLEGVVVGYMMWTFALAAFSDLSWALMREAQLGTLEQLYMCPYGFRFVSLAWIAGSFLTGLIFVGVLLGLMMLTTGHLLHLPLGSLLPLLLLTVAAVYGVGFAMAGLALVFKRIQSFFQILQFVFVALVALPAEPWWAKALPLSLGTRLIARVMIEGRSLGELPGSDLVILVANGLVYLGLGLAAFTFCERAARRRGLLAHY